MSREKLADAGFFYCTDQHGDCVICFVCGIKLLHFRGDVDPWVAHYIASNKKCAFVRYKKSAQWLLKKSANVELIRNDFEVEKRFSTSVAIRGGIIVFKSTETKTDDTEAGCSSKTQAPLKDSDDVAEDTSFICSICITERVEILFRPCMHVITCLKCSKRVKQCPHCRVPIEKCEKVFF